MEDNQKCNQNHNDCQSVYLASGSQSYLGFSPKGNYYELDYQPPCRYTNVPPSSSLEFISRQNELKKLLINISPDYRQHITVVEGHDGVGKTELVLKAADLCCNVKDIDFDIQIPRFDAIIFTSIKPTYPTHFRISNLPEVEPTLQKIFSNIAKTLEDTSILRARAKNQLEIVYQRLSEQPTLLIIDNLETLDSRDKEQVLSFVADLPKSTQAVITTRDRVVLFSSIRIDSLSKEESFRLIDQKAKSKGVSFTLYQKEKIYRRFGGIPAALIYAVGRRAMGYSLKVVLGLSKPLSEFPEDLVRLSFESSIIPLRNKPIHKLLLSLAIFQAAPTKDAIAMVAGLQTDIIAVEEGLLKLQKLLLVQKQDERYYTLATTREYILVELAKYLEFEEEARERWVEWYIKFVQKYGGKDWQDWRINYDYLDREWENIVSVLYWCAAQDRYEQVKQLWQNIDNYLDLDGYWNTRRHWWKWFIKESDRRADLPTYVKAISERAWTLTLMGYKYQSEAASEFVKAWKLHEYAELEIQANLASRIAVHRINKKKYNQAFRWLKKAEKLINQANLEKRELIRYRIYITYYRAEINYWKSNEDVISKAQAKELLQKAKKLFQWVFDKGQEIGWQRFANYAQNWVAKILIIEGDLEEAEKLLETGLLVAENNREQRRIAHYQEAYCFLEANRGNKEKAAKWKEKALNYFAKEEVF